MSRTIISLVFLALVLLACQDSSQQGYYVISGKVLSLDEDFPFVVASRFDPISQQRTPLDTAILNEDGDFEVSFALEQPDLLQLRFPDRQTATILCEPGDEMRVVAEGKRNGTLKITGSKATSLLMGYEDFRKESNSRLVRVADTHLATVSKQKDQQATIDAVEALVKASEAHRSELLEYTFEHIGTSPALYGTVLRWTGDEKIGLLDELVNRFASEHPDLDMTQVMRAKVERFRTVAIGAEIPELVQQGTDGQHIDIRDHLGEYTLIDFWASWCKPCLLQVPDIKEALETYGERGFTVFGVSFDRNAEKWKETIAKYQLEWPQVSDAKGWQSQQAKDFNITFLPFNILVNKEGVIVAKNLHSITLTSTLKDLLGESS